MKLTFILLTVYVSLSWADRSQLPNLGIARSLDLGTAHSFLPPTLANAKNVHVKVTTHKHSSQSVPQPFSHNQNIPLNSDNGISLDSFNFFDRSLHEAEPHIAPFPIIPFNTSIKKSQNSFQNKFSSSDGGSNQVFPSNAVPQPFNIHGNVNVPDDSNQQSFGGHVGFSQQPFDGYTGTNTPTYPDTTLYDQEVTRPVHHTFTQPDYQQHSGNIPYYPENQVSVDKRQEVPFTPPPFLHSPQEPFEDPAIVNRNHQGSVDNFVRIEDREKLEEILERDWSDFTHKFNKIYQTVEEQRFRREVFLENRAKIMRLNMEYAEGRRNFVHKINPYADMLLHEFNEQFCGFNRSRSTPRTPIKPASAFLPSANVVFPSSVDWREVGAVGPVKAQGKCAACWAFAAAGALEGHQFRKTGNLVDISVQNLIDCTEPYGNNGCTGGLMDPAFEYVRDNNGVDSEQSYPFEERTAECRFRREDVVATCTGFVDIDENDEKGLEIALATLGPVTAAIDAAKETFQFYSGGIYDDPECGNKPEQMNHAVLIVGYGTEADGKKYWLVKNSYGPQWGIGGYIKIAKDNNNQCGIAIQASYPLV